MALTFWDEKLETLPAARRRILRDHRLRWQVRRCWDGSPFYRARLSAAGLDPASFDGLGDLGRIPILRPADLPPADGSGSASAEWTVAPADWWRETEMTVAIGPRILTDGDLTQRAHLAARANWAAGVRPGDSLAVLAVAPPAVTTIGHPDVAPVLGYACREAPGFHWADDHFLIEAVDPESGQRVQPGIPGRLVVTDLTREGSPLIRYRSDLETVLIDEPCPCGRTSLRAMSVRSLA
jgi:phenylacetate-coenzyme A ligase PaaK-like adenylate-forming protein